jgi:hypothetical protein
MKQISSFMSEIGDEFKIVVVKAIRELCLKYASLSVYCKALERFALCQKLPTYGCRLECSVSTFACVSVRHAF